MTKNRYKSLAARRLRAIRQLKKQLQAEKRLNAALSKLQFAPKAEQAPAKLKELRKATTIKRKAYEERRAA